MASTHRRSLLAQAGLLGVAGFATGADNGAGVIALHGKCASLRTRAQDGMRTMLWDVSALEVPDMQWSITRYLAMSVQGTHDDISAIA